MSENIIKADAVKRIEAALRARHGRHLDDERFSVRAELNEGSVEVHLELSRLDQTFTYDMEATLQTHEDGGLTSEQATDICLDFLDWYLGEYFSHSRELLLPLDWQPHRFGEFEVFARGDVSNPLLDDAANALLRGESPDLTSLD